ncbi:cytochrome c-type biogenesis protein CcmH [Novosphingobium sp. PhB165]|uniref:tetratricopeptide repeat protein n=1 Tax=Novosphingobium sp. PhB165 TaxID=2485105 RepID=UPI001051F4AA|nr:tetratricopeptide repeat protein [Novosphingobium sp. PhB165]TCM19663.1 cytochrome c-type biogenesis protein CcmH [Novosphingobium sp. PhB165]
MGAKIGVQRAALVVAGLVAASAVGVAVWRGSENRPEAAAAGAIAPSADPVGTLEQAAHDAPADATAWQKLGLAYFTQNRYGEAADAYARAAAIAPDKAVLWSALGEARVMASEHDPMPEPALEAFRKAASLDKADPRARYFLAVKRDLDGDHGGALDDWLELLRVSPADAPWRTDLVRTIQQVATINHIDVTKKLAEAQALPAAALPHAAEMPLAAQGIPGPSAGDIAAAARMAPHEQREMADGMVARLEARLAAEPSNVDGWIMLMRSRMTLGESDKARKALADAIAANPARAGELRQQAEVLGIR